MVKILINKNKNEKSIIFENKYEPNDAIKLIGEIKKYLISKNYIKIKGNPVLAIYDPLIIPNLKEFLSKLRKYSKYFGIKEIFIYGTMYEIEDLDYIKLFDYCFEYPPKNIDFNRFIKNDNYFYYIGLIYKGIAEYKNNKTFRGVILEWDNSLEKNNIRIFNEYSPEKFYHLVKILINKTKIENKNNNFLFMELCTK